MSCGVTGVGGGVGSSKPGERSTSALSLLETSFSAALRNRDGNGFSRCGA